ncbi:MAG: winged helix DNA-binding domain-containing protein [Myxococcota bacterium]|nr:winged helix DNA-binding domain-containing protein [Myxococcota bacterium]
MNTQLLIDAVVQQTMVFIAQIATAGGVRAPLAQVANQVFLELTNELGNQGVTKKVIADMFGMALRTYHRKVRELSASRTDSGGTLWASVLTHVKEHEPVTARDLARRFRNDDPEVLSGVLNDLVGSGLAYRSGRGASALYRAAAASDLALGNAEEQREAYEYLAWLVVYRSGPLDAAAISELGRLEPVACREALERLVASGKVRAVETAGVTRYVSSELSIPLGTSQGWEVAVLDHFQAMVGAISAKLGAVARSDASDVVGGSTFSLDVWDGHPLEGEALGTLSRVRAELESLRSRIDAHNAEAATGPGAKRVIYYMGQYVREEGSREAHADTAEE